MTRMEIKRNQVAVGILERNKEFFFRRFVRLNQIVKTDTKSRICNKLKDNGGEMKSIFFIKVVVLTVLFVSFKMCNIFCYDNKNQRESEQINKVTPDAITVTTRAARKVELADEKDGDELGGVGIRLDLQNGKFIVKGVIPCSPAESAGILAGDEVVSVDGKSTEGMSLQNFVLKVRGNVGSRVNLEVARNNQKLKFNLQRDIIRVFPSTSTSSVWHEEHSLPPGAGKIRGKVLLDNEPCLGCRVYLSIDSKRTESSETDKNGVYLIRVPPGSYRYAQTNIKPPNGVADAVEIVENPTYYRSPEFVITAGEIHENSPVAKIGRTIKLRYPDESQFVSGSDVSFEWESHSKVHKYRVIVYPYIRTENRFGNERLGTAISNRSYTSSRTMPFEGQKETIETLQSSLVWKGLGEKLTPNRIYVWGVEAYDKKGSLITSSDISDLHSCLFYYLAP